MKFLLFGIIFFLKLTTSFSQTIFKFIGNGNWSNSSNWENSILPPEILDGGKEIIIMPSSNGECILDVRQNITKYAKLTIIPGTKFTVNTNLIIDFKPLTIFDQQFWDSSKPMALLNIPKRNIDFYFYGSRDVSGNIENVNAVALTFANNFDTIYNFTLDDSMRVKTFYRTINSIRDTSIIKCKYQNSLVVMTRYRVNWDDSSTIIREQVSLSRDSFQIANSTAFKQLDLPSKSELQIRLAKNAILSFTGMVLIYAGANSGLPGVFVGLIGVGLVMYALNDIKQMNLSLMEATFLLLDSFISSANASASLYNPDYLPKNPQIFTNLIKYSKEWNWCACFFDFSDIVSESQRQINFKISGIGATNSLFSVYKSANDNCGPFIIYTGYGFLLSPNGYVGLEVEIDYASSSVSCPGILNGKFKKLEYFTCND